MLLPCSICAQACISTDPPRYGTCVISTPARLANNSPVRCDAEPGPVEANVTAPADFFAAAT
jgi:hypothetical protein